MGSSAFSNSIFSNIFLIKKTNIIVPTSIMGGISGSSFARDALLLNVPVVVFDLETTSLNVKTARIIEIGAIKYQNKKEIGRFSQLINPECKLNAEITRVTHIEDEMLVGKPIIYEVLPEFHEFLRGCVCIAHNAEYDCGVLFHESLRLGISCDYTVICTLKMARDLIKAETKGKGLDALAQYYNLGFEARHRSIGDILVTAQVLWNLLEENPHLKVLSDFDKYIQPMLSH